eukprot:10659908-Ditylum_brightwellii.AAC.1
MINKEPRCNIKINIEQIRDRARLMGLTLESIEDKILEGWVCKPRGMKQIAFERGLIVLDNINLYTKDGPKDEDGKTIDDSFSLKKILSCLTNFVEEDTLFPKGHPEAAGEGIKYTWSTSK